MCACVFGCFCTVIKMFDDKVLEIQFVDSSLFSSHCLKLEGMAKFNTNTTQCISKYSARYLFVVRGLKTKLQNTSLKIQKRNCQY